MNSNRFTGWMIIQNRAGFNPYSPWNILSETGGAALQRGTTFRCSYTAPPIIMVKARHVSAYSRFLSIVVVFGIIK
jgi:hypothetical protein